MVSITPNAVRRLALATALFIPAWAGAASAADVIAVKTIGTDLARDIADGAVKACMEQGYSVSAVVVDRGGQIVAALRAEHAAVQTIDVAAGKARGAIMAGTTTTELRANRPELAASLNHLNDVMMMDGGVPVNAGGGRIGAVGVSGAPGGDLDEACIVKAIDGLTDRIDFIQ